MSKLILAFFSFQTIFLLAQAQNKTDSLVTILNSTKMDTNRVKVLLYLISATQSNDNTKAIEYAEQAVSLSEKLDFQIDKSYEELAWLYKSSSNYKKSLEVYFKMEKYAHKFKSPKKEEILAGVYTGLASVYGRLNNYDLAIEKGKASIKYYESIQDKDGVAYATLNLGNYYYYKQDYQNALKQYKNSENFFIQIKDSTLLPTCYNAIGSVLYQLKNYNEALGYYEKYYSLSLKNNPDDALSIAVALQNIGQTYSELKDFNKAIEYCLKAVDLFKQVNDQVNIYNTYENLGRFYSRLGKFEESNIYFIKYVRLKDSIFNEDTKSTLHEMSVKYESEKKEKENQVLTLENKNKKQIIYFALGGCILLLGLVFFVFKGYRNKQKANMLLEEKNAIINRQKVIVEEQHQDITDSIKYAQRIQGAILPPRNFWQKILPDSFVLHMPKDVLSGDFYWIEETKDYIYVAAADCTGHGVPGALMSIVNFNLLNKAVLEQNLVTPSEILDAINIWLTESLHQTYRESAVRDGMDVSLIAIHKHSNEVMFAGANNPIYIISNGQLKQIKGDKFPVGAFVEDQLQKFTTNRFTVNKGDSIYLFSDGFADQFGGGDGKKYKYAPFQKKLIDVSSTSLLEQRKLLKHEFLNWKGTLEQVDDVLLIGIKIV